MPWGHFVGLQLSHSLSLSHAPSRSLWPCEKHSYSIFPCQCQAWFSYQQISPASEHESCYYSVLAQQNSLIKSYLALGARIWLPFQIWYNVWIKTLALQCAYIISDTNLMQYSVFIWNMELAWALSGQISLVVERQFKLLMRIHFESVHIWNVSNASFGWENLWEQLKRKCKTR